MDKFFKAEAKKCVRGSLFSTEVTWEKLKSDVNKFLPKKVASTIIRTECFFHLSGFFVNFIRPSDFEIVLIFFEI